MPEYDDLKVLFINCTLKRSPELSHTQGLADRSLAIFEEQGAQVESLRLVDFEVAGGNIRMTEAYAFNLGVLHYWDPKWRSALQGTYYDANVKVAGEDSAAYSVTANLIWTPVKKLDIGGEVTYGKITNKSSTYNLDKSSEWVGRMHIQRDF